MLWSIQLKNRLERRYGQHHLHFITCSCYQRRPLLASARDRDFFLEILNDVRAQHEFLLVGYVVMPEHVHLLISEPQTRTPSTVMQVLKQRVSRELRRRLDPSQKVRSQNPHPSDTEGCGTRKFMRQGTVKAHDGAQSFWQTRFYDFNVWTRKKRIEKLHYMHMNPVKRGLVAAPELWAWSSYRFYQYGDKSVCTLDREPS